MPVGVIKQRTVWTSEQWHPTSINSGYAMSRIDRRFARLQRGLQPSRALLAILAIALFPSIASANAGTPLMWATMLHLTFGNAIIGLIEGLLLWRLFQAPRWKSIWVLVIANFASAWAGGFLIVGRLSSIVEITIENIQGWFWLFVALAFVITLLVEFPFFWFALREKQDPVRRALKATSIVHGISYLLLFGWYWAASGTSMLTQLEVVSAGEIRPAAEYTLYFITPDGGRIVRSDLEGVEKEVVTTISATHRNDRLFARQDAEGRFDLCVHLDSDERDNQKEELIMEDFSSAAPIEWRIAEGYAEKSEGTWFNFGSVPTLASDTAWEYWTGFWPFGGNRWNERGGGFAFPLLPRDAFRRLGCEERHSPRGRSRGISAWR